MQYSCAQHYNNYSSPGFYLYLITWPGTNDNNNDNNSNNHLCNWDYRQQAILRSCVRPHLHSTYWYGPLAAPRSS